MIYGIQHAGSPELRASLSLCPPAGCADALIDGSADIALVPVAALPKVKDVQIITDYCISASQRVETVALLSNTDLSLVKRIYLDSHSRTSVQLVRVLARELWKIEPQYVDNLPLTLSQGEAMVAIGDKVFEIEGRFNHKTDLAQQWHMMTGLPFVFAVWASRPGVDQKIVNELNAAISYGVRNIPMTVPWDGFRERNLRYLTQNIEFELSEGKREAINLFLSKL